MRQKRWFYNRIGKRIYRDGTSCSCPTCRDVKENGLIVRDKQHADYLFDVQYTFNIHYRDKK